MSENELIGLRTRQLSEARKRRALAVETLQAFAEQMAPILEYIVRSDFEKADSLLSDSIVQKFGVDWMRSLIVARREAEQEISALEDKLRGLGIVP